MGLTAFTPKTETVEFPGGDFAVRGLSLEDMAVLLRSYYRPIAALFDKYVAEASAAGIDETFAEGALGLGDVQGVVLEAFETAPGLIADVIARAAGEPENAALVRTLPAVVQIDAVEKIVRLTLEAEGGVEKLAETVSRLAGSLAALTADRSG